MTATTGFRVAGRPAGFGTYGTEDAITLPNAERIVPSEFAALSYRAPQKASFPLPTLRGAPPMRGHLATFLASRGRIAFEELLSCLGDLLRVFLRVVRDRV